jgi:hypothetical protein
MRKAWAERGQKPPASFEQELEAENAIEAPELTWLEQHYLVLFNMASSCRPVAFSGVLPIPYLVIADVLDRNLLTGTEHATALFVIRRLDEEIMKLWDIESSKPASQNRVTS